jgi:hypothetical protein
MIRKNQRIETLRDAFAKAATANDAGAMEIVGHELLVEYGKQPKLSRLYDEHRTIVQTMLITLGAVAELQKTEGYDELTPEQKERLPLDVGMMAASMFIKRKN